MDRKGDRSGTRMRLTDNQLQARGGWSGALQGAASALTLGHEMWRVRWIRAAASLRLVTCRRSSISWT